MKLVYVLNKDGLPLMPTRKLGKVRHLLKDGQTKIIIGETEEILKIIIDPYYEDVGFLTSYDNRKSLQARIKKLKMSDEV